MARYIRAVLYLLCRIDMLRQVISRYCRASRQGFSISTLGVGSRGTHAIGARNILEGLVRLQSLFQALSRRELRYGAVSLPGGGGLAIAKHPA